MDTLNLTEYISTMVDNLDKVIEYLKACQERTREQDIAMQKLEESVFWLTYSLPEEEE